MTRSQAYLLLGIKEGASISAIKKAYRSKAMELHPDRNPGRDTHDLFIHIVEAYDLLSNPNKTQTRSTSRTYTARSQSESSKSSAPNSKFRSRTHNHKNYQDFQESYEERYERAKRKYEEDFDKKSFQIYANNLEEYQSGYQRKIVKVLAAFGIAFCFLFLLDHYMPVQEENVQIEELEYRKFEGGEYSKRATFVYEHQNFDLFFRDYHQIHSSRWKIIAIKTSIFKDAKLIKFISLYDNQVKVVLHQRYSIHHYSFVFTILFLFPFLSLFIEKPTFNFVFFGIYYNLMAFPLMMLFLLFHEMRIERILSHFF